MRNPSEDCNPFDRASFYVESLKYGPGAGRIEGATAEEFNAQLEALLREAGVTAMTGEELAEAMEYYGHSFARILGLPYLVAYSIFADGVMHGLVLGGKIEGEHRRERGAG